MGLYVRRSPSHAANVALIFNPHTGHISPQFHVVSDDDFTTVPFLRPSQIPPFWAELIHTSSKLYVYTKRQLPELTPKIGDFTSDHAGIPNCLGAPISGVSSSSLKPSLKASKGVKDSSSTSDHTSVL
jgi:hypothetical protein